MIKNTTTIWLFIMINFSIHAQTTIIYNIKGYSVNQHKPVNFTAIAFKNDKILETGAEKAKIIATAVLSKVRSKVGY